MEKSIHISNGYFFTLALSSTVRFLCQDCHIFLMASPRHAEVSPLGGRASAVSEDQYPYLIVLDTGAVKSEHPDDLMEVLKCIQSFQC